MQRDATGRKHGLPHGPFEALFAPRPIGWIASLGPDGVASLASHGFFSVVGHRQPEPMLASAGRNGSLRNVEATGEINHSNATRALRDTMNLPSAAVARGVGGCR
jgi:flavin reductase (DIM6/NTAB) family NADH-FMN oxidoreductase RutF